MTTIYELWWHCPKYLHAKWFVSAEWILSIYSDILGWYRKEKLLLPRKLRRATMFRGKLRIAKRTVHLILTLKSNLVVVGFWPASLHALVNVADVMGKLLCSILCFVLHKNIIQYFDLPLRFNWKLVGTFWREKSLSSTWRNYRRRKAKVELVLLLNWCNQTSFIWFSIVVIPILGICDFVFSTFYFLSCTLAKF